MAESGRLPGDPVTAFRNFMNELQGNLGPQVCAEAAGRLRAEQISIIARYTRLVMTANVWNAVIVVLAMYGDDRFQMATAWAAVTCFIAVYAALRQYARSPDAQVYSTSKRGLKRANHFAFILGLSWGFLPAAFFPDANETSRLILTCISAGMMAAGAFALASVPSAAFIFSSLMLVGSLAGLLREGRFSGLFVASLMIVYLFVLLRGAWVFYTNLKRNVLQRYEAERMAKLDTLTRLPNRVGFHEQARNAYERYRRTGESFAILYLDLDGLKKINDTYGHRTGDHVLINFGQRLESSIRTIDFAARLSGDEFAVVLSDVSEPGEIAAVADRIIQSCNRTLMIDDTELHSRVSIGIAIVSPDILNIDVLVRRADSALYRAKANNRGGFNFFNPEQDVTASERKAFKDALVMALGGQQFVLNFQPILDVKTGHVAAFEALVRWNHPQRGLISPGEFIPAAEETGMINSLGLWVMDEACALASTWPEDVRIAVNVSAVQFRDPMLVDVISNTLQRHNINPARLDVEITETAILNDCDATRANLEAIRALGAAIVLDDFGTGYASLGVLQNLKCDALKIDRCFVANIGVNPVSTAIVTSLVEMARSLNLAVIAEGVETQAQLTALQLLGCPYAQGYFISRPVTGENAITLIESFKARNRFRASEAA